MKTKISHILVFLLELVSALLIPFILWWKTTPTNVLNSSPLWESLEKVGIFGSVLFFCVGIPLGVVGLLMQKKMGALRIPTIIFSVFNIVAGALEVAVVALIIIALAFLGAITNEKNSGRQAKNLTTGGLFLTRYCFTHRREK